MPATAQLEVPRAAGNATAQINVRLNPLLKQRGDEGLASAGLSASQAIRALWDLAARNAENPAAIQRSLFPEKVARDDAEQDESQRSRIAAIERGSHIVEDAYKAAGLPWSSPKPEPSYEELKEQAYFDRYADLMGWEK